MVGVKQIGCHCLTSTFCVSISLGQYSKFIFNRLPIGVPLHKVKVRIVGYEPQCIRQRSLCRTYVLYMWRCFLNHRNDFCNAQARYILSQSIMQEIDHERLDRSML